MKQREIKWSKKLKGISNVACVEKNGDLYIAYEGGEPVKVRDLLNFWYESLQNSGDAFYLKKTEINRCQRINSRLKEMILSNKLKV